MFQLVDKLRQKIKRLEKDKNILFWYDAQKYQLFDGLKTYADLCRLYEYANCKGNQHLPERADTWQASERIKALGYDPMDYRGGRRELY